MKKMQTTTEEINNEHSENSHSTDSEKQTGGHSESDSHPYNILSKTIKCTEAERASCWELIENCSTDKYDEQFSKKSQKTGFFSNNDNFRSFSIKKIFSTQNFTVRPTSSPLESFLASYNVEIKGIESLKQCFSHGSEKIEIKTENQKTKLNLLERIDKDQPRSENTPFNSRHLPITPIGDDFSFLRRIYFRGTSDKNTLKETSAEKNKKNLVSKAQNIMPSIQFKNDIKVYLSRKNLTDTLTPETVTQIVKDQEGSRFIQKRLDQSEPHEWFWLTQQIDILELCTDLFGNYVIQKLIDNGKCKKLISECVVSEIVPLSLNTFGCRVVQKLLTLPETAEKQNLDKKTNRNKEVPTEIENRKNEEMRNRIVEALKPHLLSLVYDSNGNHVVQRICSQPIDFVNLFYDDCLSLSKHKYGCRVLQKLFENNSSNEIITKLTNASLDLAENQYGNYVLQHVMSINYTFCKGVTEKVFHCLFSYSIHKFASNVVERIILCLNELLAMDNNSETENQKELLKKVILSLKPHILEMSTDKYANYVVQRILETPFNYLIRLDLVRSIPVLKNQVYAKGIVNRLRM